ncbi:phosphoglycerol transferase [Leucobacter luti]|uniref:LTA synthase family protein n=1 Tax=Leucobacter luti TaxID=340320 RepID=UPI00104897D7|nr:LTA synthase family protein [Leucobacter luti]MCW2289834.1 phosphoglycerol transferase [Leucobacter luti]TCK36003.1 phosphoglycerol transferase [Leucobacter luti]
MQDSTGTAHNAGSPRFGEAVELAQQEGELDSIASHVTPQRPRARYSRIWASVFWSLIGIGAVCAGIALWVRRTFGIISIDQLLSNLPGGGGEGAGGSGIVVAAVVTGIAIPIAVVLVLAFLVSRSLTSLREAGVLRGSRERLRRLVAIVLAVVVPVTGAGFLGATIGVRDYVSALAREAATGANLGNYYVAPEVPDETTGSASGVAPKNLILIYLESIEDAFADDELFEKNMLAPVEQATAGWDSIPRLAQYEGGGWTMSGIVSTQCGIPLRTASSIGGATELNDLGAGAPVAGYLPGATCLGDVLAGAGYQSVFLGGADASFAGKGAFLTSHGTDEIHDLQYWQDLDEQEFRPDWGLSDRRLFERAKDTVVTLHDSGEPFALTMLTLDTHEGPMVYDYCDWDTETAMTSITLCSMTQVASFVDFLGAEGILDDTVVMLTGDHQKMIAEGGSFWEELNGVEGRTIFNRIWSPDGVAIKEPDIDQFSVYPTLLELLGFELQDHRAGIGVSALASDDEVPAGTIRDLSHTEYRDLARSRSVDFYHELWGDR